jgi:hypothetical protein
MFDASSVFRRYWLFTMMKSALQSVRLRRWCYDKEKAAEVEGNELGIGSQKYIK